MEGVTMKRIILITVVVLLSFCYAGAQETAPDWDQLIENTDWNLYSKNLVKAMNSHNLGLQVSAMQQIIKYKDNVNVDQAVQTIFRLYRRDKDVRVRQMALKTIYELQNDYALGILERDVNYEKSSKIKRMLVAILNEQSKKISERKTGDEIMEMVEEPVIVVN